MITIDTLFDFSLLFDDEKNCRLCKEHIEDGFGHKENCPGRFLNPDNLKFSLKFSYGGCSRGCCHWTDKELEADDIDTLAKEYFNITRGENVEGINLSVIPDISGLCLNLDDELEIAVKKVKTEVETQEAAVESARLKKSRRLEYERSRDSLEAERKDLVPEAYNNRLADLNMKYDDVRD